MNSFQLRSESHPYGAQKCFFNVFFHQPYAPAGHFSQGFHKAPAINKWQIAHPGPQGPNVDTLMRMLSSGAP
jgi:hypothetical protein